MLRHFSHREKKLLYWAAVIIGGVCVYIFLIDPIITRWIRLNEEIAVKKKRLIKNYKIIAQKERITSMYEKYAKEIRSYGTEEEETATILKEVETLARKNRVYITDIKPRNIKDGGFYKEYFVELETEGTMENLAQFIYMLQSSRQVLKVKYLRITAKPGSENILKAFMTISKVLVV